MSPETPRPRARRRGPGLALRSMVSLGLLAWVARSVDWSELAGRWSAMSWTHLLLLAGMAPVSVLLSVWKWRILLASRGARVPGRRLFGLYVVGQFYNQVLPSSVGGDVVRGLGLQRQLGSRLTAYSSIFVERLTGFAALVVLGAVTVAATPALRHDRRLLGLVLVSLLGVAGVLSVIGVAACGRLLRRIAGRAPALARALDRTERFRRALGDYRGHPAALAGALLLSFAFYGGTMCAFYLAARALGYELPFVRVAAVVPAAQLAATVPVTLNGIGMVEWVFTVAFAGFGLPPVAGLSAALLVRLRNVVWSALGYAVVGAAVLRPAAVRPAAGHDGLPDAPEVPST